MDSLVSTSKPGPLRDKLGHFCSANPAQTILPPDGAGGVDYLLPLNSRQSRELSRVRGRAKDLIAALGGTAAGKPDHKNGDDRLWATRHGVIDGFETLSQIVLRIIDKERHRRVHVVTQSQSPTAYDDAGLDKRITDELDRLAARRRAAGAVATDRPRD